MKTGKYNRRKCYRILQQVCTKEGVPASMVSTHFYQKIKELELIQGFKSKHGYIYRSPYDFVELKEKIKIMIGIDLDKWVTLTKESTREDVAAATGSSKAEKTNVDFGFRCNVYPKPIEYKYDGKKHTVLPAIGLSLLVSDWRKFYIPKTAIIISSENFSPMLNIEKYIGLWNTGQTYFFVLRDKKTKNIISWLNTNQPDNEVYHFGDYDMSGLEVYQTLKKEIHLKERYDFFKLPLDIIEKELKLSKSDLYFKQYSYANVDTSDSEVRDIAALIMKYGKTIEQEKFPEIIERWKNNIEL